MRFSQKIRFFEKNLYFKMELHIRKFSENSRERWARIGEQVMCGSLIRIFSVFIILRRIDSWHFQIFGKDKYSREYWRVPYVKSQFSPLLVNLCETARECYEYLLFSTILRESTYVQFHLNKKVWPSVIRYNVV